MHDEQTNAYSDANLSPHTLQDGPECLLMPAQHRLQKGEVSRLSVAVPQEGHDEG